MDEKLSQALERSNFMTTFATQKRLLLEKYHDDLIYYKDGHEIQVTQSLINFCVLFVDKNRSPLILTDANNLPFQVDDVEQFMYELLDVYAQASNSYYTDFTKLKQTRTVEGLVDL